LTWCLGNLTFHNLYPLFWEAFTKASWSRYIRHMSALYTETLDISANANILITEAFAKHYITQSYAPKDGCVNFFLLPFDNNVFAYILVTLQTLNFFKVVIAQKVYSLKCDQYITYWLRLKNEREESTLYDDRSHSRSFGSRSRK
jgi:hypothetical protein